MAHPAQSMDPPAPASSSTSIDVNDVGPSFRPSPSPSVTSQSDDPDRDDDDDDADEEDFTDGGPSTFGLKERRNTLKARGSAALEPRVNASDTWNISPATAQTASAATLPHEILLHIFRYVASDTPSLRSSLRVCKAWCLCGVELLWHRPSLQRIANLFQLIHIIRRQDQTFPYATFIRRLNLSSLAHDLEDSLFSRLAVCTRLERLTLTGCTQISDDMIANVLQNCKHLVAVDFSDVTQLTDHSVMTVAQNSHRLQGINLTGCKQITSASVVALAKNCKNMRRVKLCGCELVTDEALTALCEHCPVILEIDLINCPLITDASVRRIWRHSFHMRELRLAQCGKLTDLAFPAPPSNLAGGSLLQGPGVPDSAPASRGSSPLGVSGSAQLESVQGSGLFPSSSTLSDAPLCGHLRATRIFDHLRILDMTNCITISDAAIEGIVACVPRLRNLILAKCTRLTNESAYSIARLGKNLHYLHLGHVSNLTDRAVCHLARSCTRLRYIDLACCPQLTDLSVIELATNLPKLRRIGLVRVTNLTDQAIYSLVERYTSLERIHLSYCENITVPAIFWLLERLTRLTHLSLTGVPDFRHPDLQSMRREPPKEFNAHQRAAFCVYSGKGVHELRKFLQKAYSSSKPPFRELRPEVQAYWRQATANSAARRQARQQAQAQHDVLDPLVTDEYWPSSPTPIASSSRHPAEMHGSQAQSMDVAQQRYIHFQDGLQRIPSYPVMAAPSAATGGRPIAYAPENMFVAQTGSPNLDYDAMQRTFSARVHAHMMSQGMTVGPMRHLATPADEAPGQANLQPVPANAQAVSVAHPPGSASYEQPSAHGMAALATPPAGMSYDSAHVRDASGQGRGWTASFTWNSSPQHHQAHDAPAMQQERHDERHTTDAHGDDIFANAEESLDDGEPTPGDTHDS